MKTHTRRSLEALATQYLFALEFDHAMAKELEQTEEYKQAVAQCQTVTCYLFSDFLRRYQTQLKNSPLEEVFELTTSSGTQEWVGKNGVDASIRYAYAHPGETILAYRYPKNELKIGMIPIAN